MSKNTFDLIYLLLSKNRQCYLSNTMVVHTGQYISITLLNDKKKLKNNNYSKYIFYIITLKLHMIFCYFFFYINK
jgi:hypothetical protein